MSLDATKIVDLVEERIAGHRAALRKYLDSMPTPPGLQQPTDEQFVEFVKQQGAKYPPVPLRFPVVDDEGLPVLDEAGQPIIDEQVVSPWLAMLTLKRKDANGKPTREPLVDGGEQILARIERLMGAV